MYARCIHCGLCLQQCPTYRVLGREADSPRGRIYQILQVDAGRLTIDDSFVLHLDRCLGCRACETACPSGVQYGRILERARAEIEQNYKRPWLDRKLRMHFFGSVLHDFPKLARYAKWVRLYQRSGLQSVLRATGILKLLGVAELDALSPTIEPDFYFREFGNVYPAFGERRGRVALLAGCIASVAFAELNRATVRVLTKNGIEVVVPKTQTCCGALHAHAGALANARELAKKNIDAISGPGIDAVISNAAGCGCMMKEYGELLEHDAEYSGKAREFAARVRDINEYLAELGLRVPARKVSARVTYQDPCHLAHGQKVRSAPRDLLKAIGVDLVEMPRADDCCGSAGTYNIVQNELSMRILDEKMANVATAAPAIIATANVGCMLQLRAGVKRSKINADVVHVVELLDRAYQSEDPEVE
ncbi:MAG: (Fe-S)-binding protein [Acidobacteriaceae bacterium]